MPTTIRVSDLRIEPARGLVELSARVDSSRMGWRGERLWLRMPPALAPAVPHGDPFAVALILPAMAAGADLIVDASVSPSLTANLARAQDLLVAWAHRNPLSRLRRVGLHAAGARAAPAGAGTGLFFSGGVDSLYSLLCAERGNGQTLDALLFVHGFDTPLAAVEQAASVVEHLSAVARAVGRPLMTLQTNLRRFTDPALVWDMAHGSALAAVGHGVAGRFDRLLVSSADADVGGLVSGSTRHLDTLWSGGGLTFETVGIGAARNRKLEVLAAEPLAHQHLIVCWQPRPGAANCGRCAKCLSTMLALLTHDALASFETFPRRVEPAWLRSIVVDPIRIIAWEGLLPRLRNRPSWSALARGVEALIERSRRAERRPAVASLLTRDGRQLATFRLRNDLRRHLPVGVRRRLLAARGRFTPGGWTFLT